MVPRYFPQKTLPQIAVLPATPVEFLNTNAPNCRAQMPFVNEVSLYSNGRDYIAGQNPQQEGERPLSWD